MKGTLMKKNTITGIINNLASRNIQASYYQSLEEVKSKILELISIVSSISIGNSRTLKEMNISAELTKRGYRVLYKTLAKQRRNLR